MRLSGSIFIFILFASFSISFAQEITIAVNGNPALNSEINKNFSAKSTTDTLELPFWDDFSYTGPYPDNELWIDQAVYINTQYAAEPPTWGMATFDAINSIGEFYEDASYENSFIADHLTSKPINLDLTSDDNVYLSFFFCPQGYTDAPELEDSLVLEFWNKDEQVWEQAWFAEGSSNTGFQFVIIPITEDRFLQKGFSFRFKNYASLGSSSYPDLAINVDHWHIDYVYLNKNRTASDNSFPDLAFTSPLNSIITPYSAMPWTHFLNNPEKYISEQINTSFRNNDDAIQTIDSLKLSVSEYPEGGNIQTIRAGSFNVPAFASQEISIPANFTFSDNGESSTTLELKARLVASGYDSVRNNSITRLHTFDDFYAYDDGSAEAGYGLYGSGTKYGRIAYKFCAEKPMNIVAVQMYFNRSLNDEGRDYFWLNIWEQDETGMPATEPLFSQEGVRPEYDDELNKFHTYTFDEPVFTEDTFFVGWTQTQAEMLNVGFDYNTKANQHLYYNISGEWVPSQIEGAVMIRPVVTDAEAKNPNKDANNKISVNPNPATFEIIVNMPSHIADNMTTYNIYSLTGQLIKSDYTKEQVIDVSSFEKGIYIIKIFSNTGQVYSAKFVIIR